MDSRRYPAADPGMDSTSEAKRTGTGVANYSAETVLPREYPFEAQYPCVKPNGVPEALAVRMIAIVSCKS